MRLKNNGGVTLIECLISLVLVSTLLVSVLGAFFVSKLSALRAKHRVAAMSRIKEYMEPEIRGGFLGGYGDGDYYVTVASASAVPVRIDDMGTVDTSDDLMGQITAVPYTATITAIGTRSYKTIGFVVEWNESVFGPGTACKERAITYVPERS